MTKKTVYVVTVEITQEVLVVADDWEKAKEIAMENYEEDFENGNERDAHAAYATEIYAVNKEFKGTIPWGVSDDDPRRDWTVEQWLAEGAGGSQEG